jgi:putative tryptophan/tyrosine transport system substrate-binding protein
VNRRTFVFLLAGAPAARPLAASAQQPGKVTKVGVLNAGSATPNPLADVSKDAFEKLGWFEGKNITFERRYAGNYPDRLPELAAELVRLKVDLIMAGGTLAPLAAKRATTTIPIVMTSAGDPVGSGLVSNLARPEANVTGLSFMSPDLMGKRLQLLKEVVPRIASVAVLWDAANPYPLRAFKETQQAAQALGIEVQSLEVRRPDDFAGAFEAAKRQQPDALFAIGDPLISDFRKQIVDFASTQRLPAVYPLREYAEVGGLMSYGASASDLVRRAAGYVDKILRGAQPGDLPVEQPTTFELVINLKTAKTLGLTIPPSVLGLADEMIE